MKDGGKWRSAAIRVEPNRIEIYDRKNMMLATSSTDGARIENMLLIARFTYGSRIKHGLCKQDMSNPWKTMLLGGALGVLIRASSAGIDTIGSLAIGLGVGLFIRVTTPMQFPRSRREGCLRCRLTGLDSARVYARRNSILTSNPFGRGA